MGVSTGTRHTGTSAAPKPPGCAWAPRHQQLERIARAPVIMLASQVSPLLDTPPPPGGVLGGVEQFLQQLFAFLLRTGSSGSGGGTRNNGGGSAGGG